MKSERVSEMMTQAYRALGYEVQRFRDGSKGVFKCPAKTIALMTTFGDLICDELDKESASDGAREGQPPQAVHGHVPNVPHDV
jgi:hypothetical protein